MKKRIKGLLIGCAYGDALGMPSEMMSRETLNKAFPDGVHDFLESTPYDFIGRSFQRGEVTDDTINTLLVCDCIIENNGQFCTNRYIELLQNWVKENGDKNPYIMGPSTTKALNAIANGAPIGESGKFGTTNGSAMKVSPLGIITDYHNLDELVKTVEKLCLPTHNTNIAITGASIIAAISSYVLRGGKDIEELWNISYQTIEAAKGYGNDLPGASMKRRLEILQNLIKTKTQEVVLDEIENVYGASMETIETVPTVLALITLSQFDPIKCARLSANLSGDTDTIGAIATAICGAVNFNFTQEDITLLEQVNNVDFESYADKLVKFM